MVGVGIRDPRWMLVVGTDIMLGGGGRRGWWEQVVVAGVGCCLGLAQISCRSRFWVLVEFLVAAGGKGSVVVSRVGCWEMARKLRLPRGLVSSLFLVLPAGCWRLLVRLLLRVGTDISIAVVPRGGG